MGAATLITPQQAAGCAEAKDCVFLDATWHMPASNRDARAEFMHKRIPGAVFFDLDAISDRESSYPHMLPSPAQFGEAMTALGIGNETHVIIYDCYGMFSAARAWWMLRVFGHEHVQVLDGGLPRWENEGFTLESGARAIPDRAHPFYQASFRKELVVSAEEVLQASKSREQVIIDARSPGRFSGSEPEPRAGLRSGHIPASLNIQFTELLDGPERRIKTGDAFEKILRGRKIVSEKPIISSCGSGVTACVLALAMHANLDREIAVYDGSWAEWGARPELPVS